MINIYQTLLPLGSIVLALGSIGSSLPGGRGRGGRSNQEEEILDQARVALGQHLHHFEKKFGI